MHCMGCEGFELGIMETRSTGMLETGGNCVRGETYKVVNGGELKGPIAGRSCPVWAAQFGLPASNGANALGTHASDEVRWAERRLSSGHTTCRVGLGPGEEGVPHRKPHSMSLGVQEVARDGRASHGERWGRWAAVRPVAK